MSILDLNIQFHQLRQEVQNAFTSQMAVNTTLRKTTKLYRFCGSPDLSPWWTEAIYLHDFLYKAKESKKSLFDYVRANTAVLRGWDRNSTSHLVVAALKEDLTPFKGTISPQNEAQNYTDLKNKEHYKEKFTKSVFFPGGGKQVFVYKLDIPKYKGNDVELKKKNEKERDEINLKYLSYIKPFGSVSIYDNDINKIITMCSF